MSRVTKSFGDNVALKDVDITLNYGEVHGIIGENGAGKSTLMRILTGRLSADCGLLVLEGNSIELDHAAPGKRTGISFVEQEGGLIAEFSGAENLILAESHRFFSNRKRAAARLEEFGQRFGGHFDLGVPVHTLPMGERQRIEILIALTRRANVLILDEPTASLGSEDAKVLAAIIRKFVSGGGSVYYISHKLQEVKSIADRITVLRRGVVVGRHASSAVTINQLAAEMIGAISPIESQRRSQSDVSASSDVLIDIALGTRTDVQQGVQRKQICALHNVSTPPSYRSEAGLVGVELTVNAGEVLGVAGVVGSGQTTLAEVLAGLVVPISGVVERCNGPVAYVPEDRHRDAIAPTLTIRDNLMVHFHWRREFVRGLWPRRAAVNRHVDDVLKSSGVAGAPACDAPLSSLSGGNQQKLVLGRELEQCPELLIVHNPFRGLDVRAIQNVREAILKTCQSGAGVVMISSDLDEVLQLAHRVVVLFAGRIMGEVSVETGRLEALGELMGGVV